MPGIWAGVPKGPAWQGLLMREPLCGHSSVAPHGSPGLGETEGHNEQGENPMAFNS